MALYKSDIYPMAFEHGGDLFNEFKNVIDAGSACPDHEGYIKANVHDFKTYNRYSLKSFYNICSKIDFSANINPFGLSDKAINILKNIKLTKFLIETYPEIYPDTLINFLSVFHPVKKENLFIGSGATNLIYNCVSLIRPKHVLIVEPSFSEYETASLFAKANIIHFCTYFKDYFMLKDDCLHNLFNKIRILNSNDIIFLASPSNPAGIITTIEKIKEILKECKKKGVYLILDESFMDFNEEFSSKTLINEFDNLILIRSMTKFFAIPGERVGYIISDKNNIMRFTEFIIPWQISGLGSALACASLLDEEYIKNTILKVNILKDELYNDFKKLKIFDIIEGKANFLLIKITTDSFNAIILKEYLLKSGILIRYAGNYRCVDDSFFRVAVKKRKENKMLIKEIKKFVEQIEN